MQPLNYLPSRLLVAGALAASSTLALAQTWDRGAGTEFWGDAANWDPDGVPVNNGTANIIFGTTGAGTVNLGGVTRNVNNVTVQGTANYAFAGGAFNLSGIFTNNATGGTQQFNSGASIQGTGSVVLNRTLRMGNFGTLNVAGGNRFSGGTTIANGATLLFEYGGFTAGTTPEFTYQFGTGNIQFGTGVNGSQGGSMSFNSGASARMTMANNFVNGITRTADFGTNSFEIRYDGGIGVDTAAVTRLTGNFTSAALSGGATGHGWGAIRGRSVTDGTRQFSAATYEISGNWTGYAPVNSKLTLHHAAFVLENANSVANHLYTLNSNNAAAQSTVLALGAGFGANTFNRAINIEVGTTGNSNAANAINQTYIGGRQAEGTTNGFSGPITFNNTNAHRLNLFSEDGHTEFSGNITASANQVVAINSNYTMATSTSTNAVGITLGNALTNMTPDGVVAFTGGTKSFGGGVEVIRGTLLINQAISGNVSVAENAFVGTSTAGSITGNLTLANNADLAFTLGAPGSTLLNVSGTSTLFNGFDLNSISITTSAGFGQGTYTLLSSGTLAAFTLGSNLTGTFGGLDGTLSVQGNNLMFTVIPEPSAFGALAGLGAIGFAALRRRPRA